MYMADDGGGLGKVSNIGTSVKTFIFVAEGFGLIARDMFLKALAGINGVALDNRLDDPFTGTLEVSVVLVRLDTNDLWINVVFELLTGDWLRETFIDGGELNDIDDFDCLRVRSTDLDLSKDESFAIVVPLGIAESSAGKRVKSTAGVIFFLASVGGIAGDNASGAFFLLGISAPFTFFDATATGNGGGKS